VSKISIVSLNSLILKNTHSPERLFLAVLMLAFLLVQATGFYGSISIPNSHVDDGYAISYALEIWLTRLLYPLAAIFLLMQSGQDFIQRNQLLTIPVAGVLLIATLQARAGGISPAILAAFLFVVWINKWTPSSAGSWGWLDRSILQVLLVYLIAPLALLCLMNLASLMGSLPEKFHFIIDRTSNDGLFRGESFRGFARDRIAYSYLCGLALLYLLAVRSINASTCIWIGLLLVSLSVASSRAVLVALVVAACLVLVSKRSALFFFAGGLAAILAAAFFSGRPDFFGDPGNRIGIFFAYLDQIQASPLLLLTGEGHFGSDIQLEGGFLVRPHSWFLNSIINFGILTAAAWIIFLFEFFRKLNAAGRSVLIYFVTVGFFHNGFDAYFFSMEQLLGFLFAMTLSMKMSRPHPPCGQG
jgi:hypothetical protein